MKKLITILAILGCLHCGAAPAFTQHNIERAAIGEAGNQGFIGMEAVCCAIRNRGTLQGVYGYNSSVPDKSPKWVWEMAQKAYSASATNDLVHGCQYWESTNFKRPSWSYGMQIRFRYKQHIFYYQSNYKKP